MRAARAMSIRRQMILLIVLPTLAIYVVILGLTTLHNYRESKQAVQRSMTQLAVGRNWRQASPEQQKTLIEEFKTLLVRTYATAFTQYRSQTVDYRPLRMGPGDTEVVVKSLIRQPAGQPIAVDYSMERVGGAWKVYDVKIEGISLVDNYRNTFSGEIQRGGVDGLIRTLSNKNKALAAQWARQS